MSVDFHRSIFNEEFTFHLSGERVTRDFALTGEHGTRILINAGTLNHRNVEITRLGSGPFRRRFAGWKENIVFVVLFDLFFFFFQRKTFRRIRELRRVIFFLFLFFFNFFSERCFCTMSKCYMGVNYILFDENCVRKNVCPFSKTIISRKGNDWNFNRDFKIYCSRERKNIGEWEYWSNFIDVEI